MSELTYHHKGSVWTSLTLFTNCIYKYAVGIFFKPEILYHRGTDFCHFGVKWARVPKGENQELLDLQSAGESVA